MTSKQIKLILITITIFLLLLLFYKWQIKTSSYYLNQGNDIYSDENFNEALRNYKYAAAIDGNRNIIYEAKIKRAEIFYYHWQLDKAEKELLEAIKEKQNDSKAYELLGDVYLGKREFDQAINYYEKALELNNEKRVQKKLAESFIAKQDLNSAYDLFLNLQSENDNCDNDILYYLGLLDFNKNISDNDYLKKLEDDENYKNKIREIKNVLEIYSNEKNSDYNNAVLADLYNKINEPYLAINKIASTIKNNPSYRDAWIVSGKSNFIIGDYKRSLKDFNKALILDNNNLDSIIKASNIIY